MAIQSVISTTQQYVGNGSQTVFPFPFEIFHKNDIQVFRDAGNGAVLDTVDVDYTVSGVGNDAGGNITFSVAPINGTIITFNRKISSERTADYQPSGAFNVDVVNNDFDRLMGKIQELETQFGRTVVFPPTSLFSGSLQLPDPSANEVLAWDATGENLVNKPVQSIPGVLLPVDVQFGGTGAVNQAGAKANLNFLDPSDIGVTVQGYDANTAKINVAQTYTKPQRGAFTTLTDGATITPNFSLSNNFTVTLAGNRTLENPSNIEVGQCGTIVVRQDATGNRTLTFGTYYKFQGGDTPTLTSTASGVDRLDYQVVSATEIHVTHSADWR